MANRYLGEVKTLVVGYGNTLRQDDGFGVLAAEILLKKPQREQVTIVTCHQLTPELADTLVRFDRVAFIDAAAELFTAEEEPGTILVRPILPRTSLPTGITHHFDPGVLLALARLLYGHEIEAMLFTVKSASFDMAEGLTPALQAVMPEFLQRVQAWIDEGGR